MVEEGKLYIAGSDKVTVMDIGSNLVEATISIMKPKSEVALTPDGSFAYVSNNHLHHVSVIDTALNSVVTTIPVRGHSFSLAMAPDGSYCYVGGNECLWLIDIAKNVVSSTIPLNSRAWDVVIMPNSAKVYVTQYPNYVVAIDTGTNEVVSDIGIGLETQDLAASPDGTRLYTANQDGSISVINTATDEVINTIYTNDNAIYGIGITPDGTRAYTGGYSYISVVDLDTKVVITELPYAHCSDVEISPGGTRAYVSSGPRYDSKVYVIDTVNNNLIATIPGVSGNITMMPPSDSDTTPPTISAPPNLRVIE